MKYSAWRILLFVVALVGGYLLGLGGWLLVLVALVVAFAVSYLALSGPRDDAARWLADRAERRKARARVAKDADADYEDTVVDRESRDAD